MSLFKILGKSTESLSVVVGEHQGRETLARTPMNTINVAKKDEHPNYISSSGSR